MENSHIEWTDHTFNPWIGCTKVSPGCLNCYAETMNNRWKGGVNWGKGAPRQRTSEANWLLPLKWERDFLGNVQDASEGTKFDPPLRRPRVFCASLADWLDDEVCCRWFVDLLRLIHATPNLDWLLLTKRPQNWIRRMIPALDLAWGVPQVETPFAVWVEKWLTGQEAPANVWLGTSVEDQTRADERIPALLDIPARIRFLSCEPLLGPVDLKPRPSSDLCIRCGEGPHAPHNHRDGYRTRGIDWVICGGESGPGARPMHPDWAKGLRDQCQQAGVAFFFKQWGEWAPSMPHVGCSYVHANGLLTKSPGLPASQSVAVKKVGKKAAGRELVMRTWDEFPNVEVTA